VPIVDADVLARLSVVAAAGDTTASTPAASLGDQVSTTAVSGTALNNIFDDVTGDENAASDVEYRCVFILNNHGTLTLTGVKLWLASEVAGGASLALGADPTAASAKGSGSAQAVTIATEQDAPAGVSFSAPTTKAAGISLGDIGPGQVKAFWLRRTAAASAALNSDGATWQVQGDTAA
jgi:hypothetical protein